MQLRREHGKLLQTSPSQRIGHIKQCDACQIVPAHIIVTANVTSPTRKRGAPARTA